MIKKIVLLTILITFFNQPGFGEFDELGTSARAVGMGDNFVAVCDDTYAIIYNPAGLGNVRHKEIATNTNILYAGLSDAISESFAGCLYNTPKYGTFGFGLRWFKAAQLYEEDTTFISYGKSFFTIFGRTVFLGANMKMLTKQYAQTIYTENAIDTLGNTYGRDPVFASGYAKSGTAYDLGFLSKINDRISIGTVFKNINEPDMGMLTSAKVPLITKLGISYRDSRLTVPFEIESSKGDVMYSSGFERWVSNQIALRAGLQIGTRDLSNSTFGLSYDLSNVIRIDYGFSFPFKGITDTYGSHRFSIIFSFGMTAEDKKAARRKISVTRKDSFKNGVKAFNKNEYIRAYDLFKEVSQSDPDPKVKYNALKHINIIVTGMKSLENENSKSPDKNYYYAHGLLMYIYNNYAEALKSWQLFLDFDKNNAEVNKYIKDLKNMSDTLPK
ncbi:MAG: hypothetical protein LHV68_02515 [Elusimicrobia bacterium]|nr:hypothetical protein [Candidatus Liberimonas magnetica]